MARILTITAVALLLGSLFTAAPLGDCQTTGADSPRTLVLALDGISLRVAQAARDQGAFAGWPEPLPLVSTFPSLTNVAFTAMLRPFGVDAARGYEVQYFDRERNTIVGRSPFKYDDRTFAWRERFDPTGKTVGGKLSAYTRPLRAAWREVEAAEELLFSSRKELILAHVGATDALAHIKGDGRLERFLVELSDRVTTLKQRHLEQHGRRLRVVLLSDHGNGVQKVKRARRIRRPLRRAGLRPAERLEGPDDVVAATFGIVSYGAFYTRPARAETAARALIGHEGVELAFWLENPSTARIVSPNGEAIVRWREERGSRRFAYDSPSGDPLAYLPLRERLADGGMLDDEGYGLASDWLAASLESDYPDALRRVVDGLTDCHVANQATVLFSLRPGLAWGWKSAHASSWLKGGRLEGTHGGLDRESSMGFFLSDDAALHTRPAIPAEEALTELASLTDCDPASLPTSE